MQDKIKPELDDEAWAVAVFVQELGKIQDMYLNRLTQKAVEKEWFTDMNVEYFKDMMFDYVFNSASEDGSPECLFSEYCAQYNNTDPSKGTAL